MRLPCGKFVWGALVGKSLSGTLAGEACGERVRGLLVGYACGESFCSACRERLGSLARDAGGERVGIACGERLTRAHMGNNKCVGGTRAREC